MKAEELKTKTVDELSKMLMDVKKKQFNLRFQKSQGQLENTAQIRVVRRDVARIKTFMSEKAEAVVNAKDSSKIKKSSTKAA